jgi:hypothetical protein
MKLFAKAAVLIFSLSLFSGGCMALLYSDEGQHFFLFL